MAVALRAARPTDAAAIAAIYAPHVLHGTASFETEAPTADAMLARMAASAGLFPWIVAAEGECVLGYAYATQFGTRAAYGWAVETTIYLADAARRRGTGRRLYGGLVDTLRAQGFVQAIGRIALPNAPSVAVHQAVGFRRVGELRAIGWKHGGWIDVELWQCTLAEPVSMPVAPRRFGDLGIVER